MRDDFRYFARLVRLARRIPEMQTEVSLTLSGMDGRMFAAVCCAVEPGPYRAREMSVEMLNHDPKLTPENRGDLIGGFLRGALWRKDLRQRHAFFPGTRYHLWSFG